jgi:hypothetical protein
MKASLSPAPAGVLQRECACGGSAAGCSDCDRKRKLLQRSATSPAPVGAVPAVVHRVLGAPGTPLDATTRGFMESRLGHSFGRVRIHDDALAAEATQAVNANAYTVGHDIVFASGRYQPGTAQGRRLLAHELAHVVQQAGNPTAGSGLSIGPASGPHEAEAEAAAVTAMKPQARPGAGLQRQEAGHDDEKAAKPAAPSGAPEAATAGAAAASADVAPAATPPSGFDAQARALLDPEHVRQVLFQMGYGAASRPAAPAVDPAGLAPEGASPAAAEGSGVGAARETPRPGTPSDVLQGFLKLPAVDQALTALRATAGDRLRHDFASLSSGEHALVLSQSAVIGGGALAGLLANPGARQEALGLLQDRSLPTGVSGLTFQFNLTGPDQRIRFDLNVGQLLPRSWGFH